MIMNREMSMLLFAAAIGLMALFSFARCAHGQNTSRDIGGQPVKYFSDATTNSTLVASGYRTLTGAVVINTTATLYYLKLYDKATAPVCGTDTPVQVYPIPASASGNGFALPMNIGFVSGMGFCLTGGMADNDVTGAATGVAINLTYK